MKKRILVAVLTGVMLLSVSAAAEETEAVTEAVEAISEEAEEVTLEELGERPSYTALDYVTVGEYKDLPIELEPVVVTDEEVMEEVEYQVAMHDAYDIITDGTVEMGDIANIDYEGKKDDVAFDGGTAQGYDLEIGSGTFIPGFEEGLVGVEIGETVDIPLTFPEDYYSEELAGAEVVFTVTVNSVKQMPEISSELVNTISDGMYSTTEAYLANLKTTLEEQKQQAQDSTVNNELMTQLYNTCVVNSYPEDLVDYSVKEMNNYYTGFAQSYGMTLEDFVLQYFGMDIDTYNTEAEAAVKSSLEQELILAAVAETEGLTDLSDEEYEQGCSEYAEDLGYPSADDFKADYDESKIRASLVMDKAMQFVKDNAMITILEPETETEEPQEAITEAATE